MTHPPRITSPTDEPRDGSAYFWRPMRSDDLPRANALSDAFHVAHPEDAIIFEERFALFHDRCFVLDAAGAAIAGYCVAHPWHEDLPPALNTRILRLPTTSSTLLVHDVGVEEALRGRKFTRVLFALLENVARSYEALVSRVRPRREGAALGCRVKRSGMR